MTPPDSSAEHRMHMADWKDQDGGVVITRYQPFCRCGWSPTYGTRDRDQALAQYQEHLEDE